MISKHDELAITDADDLDVAVIQHGDNEKIDARRRLEARLEDIRLRREIEDLW